MVINQTKVRREDGWKYRTSFIERTHGNIFFIKPNDLDDLHSRRMESLGYDQRVFVGHSPINDSGWRYAKLLKTVAYIVTDENEYGDPVVEKWNIRGV